MMKVTLTMMPYFCAILTALTTISLEQAQKECELEKQQLQLKIASQTDPAWIEMILMRDLGVVPEGYLKVYFKK